MFVSGENEDPLPQPLLRKYIAYARRYVHPKLGEASKQVVFYILWMLSEQSLYKRVSCGKVLQNFYLELRAKPQAEATPITTRQLESLIRFNFWSIRLEVILLILKIDRSSGTDGTKGGNNESGCRGGQV